VVGLALAIVVAAAAAGVALDRVPVRVAAPAGVVLCAGSLVAVERVLGSAPPAVRMLGLIAALLYGAKSLVCTAARARGAARLRLAPRLCFTLLWFGMNPRAFAARRERGLPGARRLALRGCLCLALGTGLALAARGTAAPLGVALTVVGFSLAVHFGAFDLLAALWRARGHAVHALFVAPWRARTLPEFWARRWNVGFAEMTALLVQRPLAARLGAARARVASFAFSGLMHEVAISLPVMAGFGLPTLYFVLHGLASARRGHGRAWTFLWLVVPLPLVFHPWFVRGVVIPWVGA
jgi:alginate O-acetyltransferase complex protein AlgI